MDWKWFGVYFDDLLFDGIDEFWIGFDMMKFGEVWIDDVEVYDFWLDEWDVLILLKLSINFFELFENGDFVSCFEYLELYWVVFLLK